MMTFTTIALPSLTALALALSVAAPQAASAQDAAQVAHGEQVYAAQKCQVCHAVASKGNKANPLDGVATKLTASDIRQWITQPAAMTAKTKSTKKPPMPDKWGSLPAADLEALVAYMQTLK
jgi:mono/diheme cytochrome c family protein